MNQILVIIKYKLTAYFRTTNITLSEIVKNSAGTLVYAGFAAGAFFFSLSVLDFVLQKARLGYFLLHEFISIIFFIFFLAINVGNIIVSWSTLYKSAEVSFLFTKPVKPFKIFIIKYFDNLFYSSSTLMMILFALFLGYTVYFNLSFADFILIIFLYLIPFIIIASSLGVSIMIIVVKLSALYGARKVLIFLCVIYLFSLFLFFKVSSPVLLVRKVMEYYPFTDQYFSDLIPSALKYLPNRWFADSLYWIVNEDYTNAAAGSVYLLSAAALLFGLTIFLGHRWYYKTWLMNFSFVSPKTKLKRSLLEKIDTVKHKYLSIMVKDFLLFVRDSTQVIHLSVFVLLLLIFVSSASGISISNLSDPYMITMIYLALQLFNLLLITTLSLRFVFPYISLEGKAFWKIRSSTIDLSYIYNIKLFFSIIAMVISGETLIYFSFIKLAPHLIVKNMLIFIPGISAIVTLNYAMGSIFSNYKEKNAIRLASSRGATITFLLCIVYMLFMIIMTFNPVLAHFESILKHGNYDHRNLNTAYSYFVLFSVTVTAVFYSAGLKAIKKDF